VSNKSRHSAIKADVSVDSGAADVAGTSASPDADPDEALKGALAELWAAVSAGDVLSAELQTAAFVAMPQLTESSPEEIAMLAEALIDAASEHRSGEESAAFFRLLISLGSRSIKREASKALAELTEDGIYPPSWVTSIGKPVPRRAWRVSDVFGDRETIVVTFSYDDVEHALLVANYLAETPTADMIGVAHDADGVLKTMQDLVEPFERFEQITLAEARQRIEAPLASAGQDPGLPLDSSSLLSLPLARSRFRRLPPDDQGQTVAYSAADRAAAVEEFLRSPAGTGVGDPDSARFWATVLTGYSSRVPDEPPAQVGPLKLTAALLVHVASTFTLTAAQHDSLRPAVTAWTRWAAERQGLDEAATDHIMTRLPGILDEFRPAYDDPYGVLARGYLRDIATVDAELPWLADQRARREFAVPLPESLDPSVAPLDATDADQRAALAVAEFADCGTDDATREQLQTAVKRIVEEAWNDDPPATWEKARRLLADGLSRHDVMHRLAR
jgi:hypothetical protein